MNNDQHVNIAGDVNLNGGSLYLSQNSNSGESNQRVTFIEGNLVIQHSANLLVVIDVENQTIKIGNNQPEHVESRPFSKRIDDFSQEPIRSIVILTNGTIITVDSSTRTVTVTRNNVPKFQRHY